MLNINNNRPYAQLTIPFAKNEEKNSEWRPKRFCNRTTVVRRLVRLATNLNSNWNQMEIRYAKTGTRSAINKNAPTRFDACFLGLLRRCCFFFRQNVSIYSIQIDSNMVFVSVCACVFVGVFFVCNPIVDSHNQVRQVDSD